MTLGSQVKYYLYNHVEQIVSILEFLGCHNITESRREIRCAVPDGDNTSSVCIFVNEYLGTRVYTRPGYRGKDIIDLVQYLNKFKTATEAMRWILQYCGVEESDENFELYPSEKFILELRRYATNDEEPETEQITKDYLLQFEDIQSQEWVDDGISVETQKRWGIRYDPKCKRYIIPLYNHSGKLISVKCRTTIKEWEALGLRRYTHYIPLNGKTILFGEYQHKKEIQEDGSVIVFEGEKSVMLAEEYGYQNTVCVGGHEITEDKVKRLLKLKVDIILAFDKDVSFSDVYKEAKKLSQFTNVYAIYDRNNLLNPKDAPVDQGWLVWDILYENRKRIY